MVSTRESLLDSLKVENAHEAWREFYHIYWAALLRYARKLGLGEHQAEEVLQETMVALMRLLPHFAYDRNKGKFRNFLLTIVHRKSLAMLRRSSRNSEVVWKELRDGLADPYGNGAAADVEALALWQEALWEEAIRRVRDDGRLANRTYPVFEAYVLQRRPATEVAQTFGLKENAVYQIRNRILRRVHAEVERLKINSRTD